jgi:transposase
MFRRVALEEQTPPAHRLFKIQKVTDLVLASMSAEFYATYSAVGRHSAPPARFLRAPLLQVVFLLRRKRILMAELDYRWLPRFLFGLFTEDEVRKPTLFSKNLDSLGTQAVARLFFARVKEQVADLNFDSNIAVDYTIIEARASHHGFRPKDENSPSDDGTNFRGYKRTADTHGTARLYEKRWSGRKGKRATRGYMIG